MSKSQTAAPAAKKARQVPKGTMPPAVLKAATADEHVITEEQRVADRRADDQAKGDAMAFAVQQLSAAPALAVPPAVNAEYQAKLDALNAQYGVQLVHTKVKAVRADKLVKNGVTRPADNNLCGKIWAVADAISLEIHGVCSIALLKVSPALQGVNLHTVKTQYARWRRFNDVTGRLPTIAVHQTQGEYSGIPAV